MGAPSTQASNAIIYLTYGAFLIFGLAVAWRFRHQSKGQFLSSNRTQAAIPLALNFIASANVHASTSIGKMAEAVEPGSGLTRQEGIERSYQTDFRPRLLFQRTALGSGMFFTYPQVATVAGVQGLVVYSLSSALPLLAFAALGPIIRSKAPDGFVLTEWARRRYGGPTAIWLSLLTVLTMFLYMVAELSAIYQVIGVLTGLDGLAAIIVQAAVTVIYTSLGGFRVSFITDSIQAVLIMVVIIIGVVAVATQVQIDRSLIESSGYLNSSLLGWQLLYILPVAVLTNDFFISGFWMRTFASRTDKDLWIGVSIATVVVLAVLTFVGSTGLLGAWSGAWPNDADPDGYTIFFDLVVSMPSWVIGILLLMMISLSTAVFDSLLSATVSTLSNDFFRNKLNIWFIRLGVVLLIFPVVVVALKAPNILEIYLISDLVSSAIIPVLFIGLTDRCWWWRGFEVVIGSLGGLFTVYLFGLVYYAGDSSAAGKLIILTGGLYNNDWSAFGAFLAAPVGGVLWSIAAFFFRIAVLWIKAKVMKTPFTALTKPVMVRPQLRNDASPTTSMDDGSSVDPDKRPGEILTGTEYHGTVEYSLVNKFF